MASSKKNLIVISIVAVAVLILGITATVVIIQAQNSRSSNLPVLGLAPAFELTKCNGITFSSGEMAGKINVIDFFFTSCKGPCPVMSGHMAELYQAFKGTDKVQFVSISVDPANDSLAALQEYASRQGVTDNRWVFLRGDMKAIQEVCEGGFKLAADDLPGAHSTKFVLVDDKGQIRGYYSGTDEASMQVLRTHIRDLVQNIL